jgi:microcystin degradation protein MlrC
MPTFTVLSAQIAHETNTFSLKPTTLDDFRSRALYFDDQVRAALTNTNTEIGAHIEAAERYGWNLVQPIACSATPSGKTDSDTWRLIKDRLLDVAGSLLVDGVVLALHGAMVTADDDDAEGSLLAALREIVGAEVPIFVTVDLHANVSDRMCENCNGLLALKTYPHVDQREVGLEACKMLQSAMLDKRKSSVHVWRLPTLVGCDFGRTEGVVMPELLEMARHVSVRERSCIALEVCAGFPWSDVDFAGPSVVVTWAGLESPSDELVAPLLRRIWDTRQNTSVSCLSVEEAVRRAKKWPGGAPLVLADVADNPGAGGYGESVTLLRALIDEGVTDVAVASIADPDSAVAAHRAGVGTRIKLSLGGRFEPDRYGQPLRCEGVVEYISNGVVKLSGPMMNGVELSLGPTAVVRIDGVQVVVATNNAQVFDRSFFLSQGIDPLAQRVLVVKSSHHFRSDFAPVAGDIILVDTGGPVSPDVTHLPYRRVRRPIEPLDAPSSGQT